MRYSFCMLVKPSNPLIRALNLTLASLCFAILPNIVYADSLPERIDLFVSLFDYNSATTSYDIRSIQTDFPTRLLTPDSMLPQTSEYPLKDIQLLYKLSQGCTGKLPLSPLITEPLVFTRSLCKGSSLSPRWFARSGLIHPGEELTPFAMLRNTQRNLLICYPTCTFKSALMHPKVHCSTICKI